MSRKSEQKNLKAKVAPAEPSGKLFDRRSFLVGSAAGAAAMALPRWAHADMLGSSVGLNLAAFQDDLAPIRAEITKRHDETVQRMQTWMKQPSIAAENRGMNEGCELTMQMLRDAGFQQVTKIPTDGQPGIFATLDAGAPKTLGLYFMYDVKQVDPSEWSSPPWDAAHCGQTRLWQSYGGPWRGQPERARKRHSWRRCMPSAARAASCP